MALTTKQENFCLTYVEVGNASEAYRRAYEAENMKPETINRKAAELMENGNITARIDELKAEHKARHNVTVDSLLNELEIARKSAVESNQYSAAVSATMGKAKLLGFDRQKIELHATARHEINLEVLTDEELARLEEFFAEADQTDDKD